MVSTSIFLVFLSVCAHVSVRIGVWVLFLSNEHIFFYFSSFSNLSYFMMHSKK